MKLKTIGLITMLVGAAIAITGCFISYLSLMIGGAIIIVFGILYMLASGFTV